MVYVMEKKEGVAHQIGTRRRNSYNPSYSTTPI